VVPPEGTRGRVDFWKSGFFHIARSAGVPVVPSALDYAGKLGEVGEAIDPAIGAGPFMDRLRAFYADRGGRHPERFGPVRLREERAEVDDAA
jgi:1-acyl-sn-glycerol-3-phosphate acyltransferase